MTTRVTAPSTPRLSETARHVAYPKGIVTTAWPRVVAQCEDMGVTFDGWQHGIGTVALGKRKDGKYAATVGGIVLSIPRQVGKTFLVGMVMIALCVIFPGFTVLWTAHRTRTATKTFKSMQGMVRRKKIAPHILAVRTANGEQEILFRNGSVIMFGAREQGFGRGFDEVDAEVFDEAQILTEKALEDMVPATNQSRHEAGALLFFMGTPPRPGDPGEEFTNRRTKALAGKAANMVYVEFSADPDADPDDKAQWAKANPSYPLHTSLEAMERMRENLTDDQSFKREALGIWDPKVTGGVIPRDSWDMVGDEMSMPVDRFALGVEVAEDAAWASVSLAGQREDGRWHVELDERRDGSAWVVPYVARLVASNPQIRAVVADAGSPTAALFDDFTKAKVKFTCPRVTDLGTACLRMLEGIVVADVVHIKQPQLTAAATVATKRKLGDTGMWVFHRASSVADITPIQSATLALWGAQTTTVKKPGRSREGGRKAVVLS